MRLVSRILIVGALVWLVLVLFGEIGEQNKLEQSDPEKVVLLFGGVILTSVVLAAIAALWVIPVIGGLFAGSIYNPGAQAEKDPHTAAVAKVNAGEYAEAVGEYRKLHAKNPEDELAVTEIVRLYCEKLQDYDSAASFLEGEVQKEWPPDHSAFLAFRLADVYANYQQQPMRAREIYIQIAEAMPETRHAANAQHKLHEIDRSLGD